MTNSQNSILAIAQHNLRQTAGRIDLSGDLLERIAIPKEKIECRCSSVLRDGRTIHATAFIVRHNHTLGPAKGGIRMTPTVTMDDITALAMEMTWKTSLIGVPFGGGKSGIQCDPTNLSAADKEIVIRSFTRHARRHIGPELYVPAPDMGTNETDMGHIRDCVSYSEGTSITRGCYVTGKPIILGGIPGRREATGKGVVHTIAAACEKLGWRIDGLRVAVQGFGNVGQVAALELANRGATVVAVADINGTLIDADGLDIGQLWEHAREEGTIRGFGDYALQPGSALFEADCDCLVPAASGSQITADNAGRITARLIAEGANAPTTPEADEMLQDKGVFIIPDILCNAGGVFVSYLEYVQETQHEQMTRAEVEQRLLERMTERFDVVYDYAQQHDLSMREASMDIAVKRVVEGIIARGLLP